MCAERIDDRPKTLEEVIGSLNDEAKERAEKAKEEAVQAERVQEVILGQVELQDGEQVEVPQFFIETLGNRSLNHLFDMSQIFNSPDAETHGRIYGGRATKGSRAEKFAGERDLWLVTKYGDVESDYSDEPSRAFIRKGPPDWVPRDSDS